MCCFAKINKIDIYHGSRYTHIHLKNEHRCERWKSERFPRLTCWRVGERCGVMSQLLPPAVSAVQPAAEAHQRQPCGHAQPGDEGRLSHHAGYLLWYAEVATFLHSRWCFVCREGWREKVEKCLKRACVEGEKTWPFKHHTPTFRYASGVKVGGNCLTFWKTFVLQVKCWKIVCVPSHKAWKQDWRAVS